MKRLVRKSDGSNQNKLKITDLESKLTKMTQDNEVLLEMLRSLKVQKKLRDSKTKAQIGIYPTNGNNSEEKSDKAAYMPQVLERVASEQRFDLPSINRNHLQGFISVQPSMENLHSTP